MAVRGPERERSTDRAEEGSGERHNSSVKEMVVEERASGGVKRTIIGQEMGQMIKRCLLWTLQKSILSSAPREMLVM